MFVSMAGVFGKPTKRFSIDDAFEEDATINVYGSTTTTERSPLKPKHKFKNSNDYLIDVENKNTTAGLDNDSCASGSMKRSDGTLSSCDSDSSYMDGNGHGIFDRSQWWCYHPKVRDNWKTVLAAVLLLVIGIGLITMGIVFVFSPDPSLQGIVFIFTGMICFIPGSYHVVYIYFAVKGRSGYDFYHLPLFN